MNITLGSEFERRIAEKVDTGMYSSASEVIREGLRILFEKDAVKEVQAQLFKEEVAKGFAQLDAGIKSERSVLDILQEAQEIHAKKP